MDEQQALPVNPDESEILPEEPQVLEEIIFEELSIDGICGVY